MFDFDKHLSDLTAQTVLCVGDLMLDEFVYGDVSRISPEAPTPVIAVKRSELMIGGAGNVARNLVSLGARCVFVGVVGDDEAGRALAAALETHPNIEYIDMPQAIRGQYQYFTQSNIENLRRAGYNADFTPLDAAVGNYVTGYLDRTDRYR
jgi:sugar/nucleoside kinase (ribokinase family)